MSHDQRACADEPGCPAGDAHIATPPLVAAPAAATPAPPTADIQMQDAAADANRAASAQPPACITELFEEAHANAPLCGGVRLQWMTIAQAAATVRISKTVLSSWATRGYIASVKGNSKGANGHRLVHLDNILHFLAEGITGKTMEPIGRS